MPPPLQNIALVVNLASGAAGAPTPAGEPMGAGWGPMACESETKGQGALTKRVPLIINLSSAAAMEYIRSDGQSHISISLCARETRRIRRRAHSK